MSGGRDRGSGRVGPTVARVFLALASTAAAITAVEVGLRVGGFEPQTEYAVSIGREKIRQPFPGLRYLYPGYSEFRQEWPSNPRGYFDPVTNSLTYHTNNFGFRDDDFSLTRTDRVRIAFLGDSFCWGLGVRRADTFADLIERELNTTHGGEPVFEVLNFGLPGSNTREEAALYDFVVRHFRPDVVVVWYFLNDVNIPPKLFVDWQPKPTAEWLSEWRKRSRFLDFVVAGLRSSAFERSLRHRVHDAYSRGNPGRHAIENGLDRLMTLTDRDHVRRFLVLIPWLIDLNGSDYPFSAEHRIVREIAEQRGFSVLDLLPRLEGYSAEDLWVHRVDHHLNEIGHAVAASAFVEFFRGRLGEDMGPLLDSASSHRFEEAHPLDGTLPRNWPGPFAEAIKRMPPGFAALAGRSAINNKEIQ